MATFTLTIEMDNAAFEAYGGTAEVAAILARLADRLNDPALTDDFRVGDKVPVRDTNGNTVGGWKVEGDPEPDANARWWKAHYERLADEGVNREAEANYRAHSSSTTGIHEGL